MAGTEGLQTHAGLAGNSIQEPQESRNGNVLRLATDIEARGSVETALPLYERAAAVPGADAATQSKLADAYATLRRHDEAEAAYRTALAKNPEYGPAHLGLGVTLVRLGRAQDGLASLNKAAPLVGSAAAYDRLGVAHIVVGQPDEALASFEQANSLDPDDLDIATNLALAAALSGYREKAIAVAMELTKAVELKPYHRRNLVLVFGICEEERHAKLAAARALDPHTVESLLEHAQALREAASPKERALALGMITTNAPASR